MDLYLLSGAGAAFLIITLCSAFLAPKTRYTEQASKQTNRQQSNKSFREFTGLQQSELYLFIVVVIGNVQTQRKTHVRSCMFNS